MNKIFKTFALLTMGLIAIGCVEENLEPNNGHYDTTPGNDIPFTASTNIETVDTKTIYGATGADEKGNPKIDINWTEGDKIQIASLEAIGNNNAEYKVNFTDKPEDKYTGSHTATSLDKTGDGALQWSGSETYNFYAMYPSPGTFTSGEALGNVALNITESEKTMKAWIPVTQVNETHTTPKTGNQTIDPNMSYAYMHASSTYNTKDENGNPSTKAISLQFESAVTALQFDITANTIEAQAEGIGQFVTIQSLTLRSSSGLDLSGAFTYDFKETYTDANSDNLAHNYVTMSLGAGYTLSKGESLNVTFFIQPIAIPAGDLQLQIMFSIGGRDQIVVRTATIKNVIEPRKKYCYNDLLMPVISSDIEGSNWVSALDPQTYLTQISVPVAGNAFSSYYTGDHEQYNIEQIHGYQTLWNMGVRGFEFKTAQGFSPANNSNYEYPRGNYTKTNTVRDEYFVTNGQEMTNGPTFDQAFTYLAQQILNPLYDEEFVVIIATYQPYSGCGRYNPQEYITDLKNYFTNKNITTDAAGKPLTDENGNPITINAYNDLLVKLSSTSIVDDLKGKIAVVVRAADAEYLALTNQEIQYPTDDKFMYVDNWGTSCDCWDRRFKGYNRQRVFGQGTDDPNTYIENYLYAIASNNTGEKPETTAGNTVAFKDGYPSASTTMNDDLFKFKNGIYFIQEFARVVPESEDLQNPFYAKSGDVGGYQIPIIGSIVGAVERHLWVRWPESLSEKTNMINYTLQKSMSAKGQTATPLYINSLAGYFVTRKYQYSYLPYAGSIKISPTDATGISTDYAGMGGDIAGLAGDLNSHLYDKLTAAQKDGSIGPLGLVIMNYIGASADKFMLSDYYDASGTRNDAWATKAGTASAALPNMIAMNNFKFPLSTASKTKAKTSASVKDWADEDCNGNGDVAEASIVWK